MPCHWYLWRDSTRVLLTYPTNEHLITFWTETNDRDLPQNFWSFRDPTKSKKGSVAKFKYILGISNIFKQKKKRLLLTIILINIKKQKIIFLIMEIIRDYKKNYGQYNFVHSNSCFYSFSFLLNTLRNVV